MPRQRRGAFFSHHTYISVKNKGRFGKSKSHSCPFLFSKICHEKYIVFVTTHKKMRACFNSSSHISCLFDIYTEVLYNGSCGTHRPRRVSGLVAMPFSFVDGVRLKRRLPVIPRVRNGGVYVALAGNFSQGGDHT